MTALLGSVNGEPIFIDDIFRPIDAELRRLARVPNATTGDFRAVARETIAHQLDIRIGEILVLKAAKDALTDDDQKRLDAYMNLTTKDLISANGSSQAQADRILRAQGSSFDKELADRKRHAIIELYLHRTLWPKIVITRRMLLNEYQRRITEFTVPASVNLYTITIPIARFLTEPDPADPAKSRPIRDPTPTQITEATNRAVARARNLIAQLKAGADFATLAQDNSADSKKQQGGHWQRVQPGMLRWVQVEKTAFALPPNSIADPVIVPGENNPAETVVVIVRVDEDHPRPCHPLCRGAGQDRAGPAAAAIHPGNQRLLPQAARPGGDR